MRVCGKRTSRTCCSVRAVRLCLTAAALLLAASASARVLTAAPATASCPALQLFAVRGSGQKAWDQDGYGQPLWALYQSLRLNVPKMHATPIDYTAVPVQFQHPLTYDSHYIESVNDGVSELRSQIDHYISSPCGQRTYIYLAGYSQGAEVIDDVLQALTPRAKARVDGVVLFGDPRFSPTQPRGVDQGSYHPTLSGVAPAQFGPYYRLHPRVGAFGTLVGYGAAEAGLVRSYCTEGDPVCNFTTQAALKTCFPHVSSPGSPDCPHLTYGWQTFGSKHIDYMTAATDFLLERWRDRTHTPPPWHACRGGFDSQGHPSTTSDTFRQIRERGSNCPQARDITRRFILKTEPAWWQGIEPQHVHVAAFTCNTYDRMAGNTYQLMLCRASGREISFIAAG